MTTAQKTVKYLAIALALLLIVGIFSGIMTAAGAILGVFEEDGVSKDMTVYQVSGDVTALEIEVSAADLSIRLADGYSVESNLKYLTVEEKDGTLVIKDQKKNGLRFDNPVLILYIPKDTVFEQANVTTGAGRLRIETLSAKKLGLTLGAGEAVIEHLYVETSAEIEGGTGAITVSDGSLTDLQIEMGVGQLDMTAALYGSCSFHLGVGETNLTVLRAKEQYFVELEKGIGSITVDRQTVDGDCKLGDGKDRIEIEGGIGAIRLLFDANE